MKKFLVIILTFVLIAVSCTGCFLTKHNGAEESRSQSNTEGFENGESIEDTERIENTEGTEIAESLEDTESAENTESAEDTETVENSESAASEELVIAEDGKSEFTIWVEQALWNQTDVKAQVRDLQNFIKNKTGVELEISGDRYFDLESGDEGPAILIGSTKSSANYESELPMKVGDFVLGMSGDKILIYAEHSVGAMTGVKYFINKILSEQEGTKLTFDVSDSFTYKVEYGIEAISCAGVELSEYNIVISKAADVSEEIFAYALRYHLLKNYGYELQVTDDSRNESEYEILIGNTVRSNVTPEEDGYAVVVNGKKLQMTADGMLGWEGLHNYVMYDLFKSTLAAKYTLTQDFDVNKKTELSLNDGSYFSDNRTGDVRYMVFNVYGYGEGCPISMRQQLQQDIISAYLPDVIGFQEYTATFHENLTPLLIELGYTAVEVDTTVDGVEYVNFTPMFYRADKLTQKASGFDIQLNANPKELTKTTTWAVFETADGKEFGAITTHFMWSGDKIVTNHEELRRQHAADIVALSNKLKNEYGVPVIFGGDLNCNLVSEPVTILTEGGLALAQGMAPEDNRNNNNGHHSHTAYDSVNKTFTGVFIPKGTYAGSIDHLFATEGVTVKGFATLCSYYTAIASDHSPLIMDIELS